jgi:hypothetical protein
MFRGKQPGTVSSYSERESMDDARATSVDSRQTEVVPCGGGGSGMNAMINGITFSTTSSVLGQYRHVLNNDAAVVCTRRQLRCVVMLTVPKNEAIEIASRLSVFLSTTLVKIVNPNPCPWFSSFKVT